MTTLEVLVKEHALGKLEAGKVFKGVVADSKLLQVFDLRDELVDAVSCLCVYVVLAEIQLFKLTVVSDRLKDLFQALVAYPVEFKTKSEEVWLILKEGCKLVNWLVVDFVVVKVELLDLITLRKGQ